MIGHLRPTKWREMKKKIYKRPKGQTVIKAKEDFHAYLYAEQIKKGFFFPFFYGLPLKVLPIIICSVNIIDLSLCCLMNCQYYCQL